ncbi:MAG: NADH-quinone oxidoreductase subunit A [Methylococcales bacterium]
MLSLPFLIYLFAVLALTATMLIISHLLNPKIPPRENPLPFESGIVPTGSTDLRWTVNYYLVAILFVIFDMEAVFLYIWAAVVLDAGWSAFFGTSMFVIILLVALVYEWRMGVLEWGHKLQAKQQITKTQKMEKSDALEADYSG